MSDATPTITRQVHQCDPIPEKQSRESAAAPLGTPAGSFRSRGIARNEFRKRTVTRTPVFSSAREKTAGRASLVSVVLTNQLKLWQHDDRPQKISHALGGWFVAEE